MRKQLQYWVFKNSSVLTEAEMKVHVHVAVPVYHIMSLIKI